MTHLRIMHNTYWTPRFNSAFILPFHHSRNKIRLILRYINTFALSMVNSFKGSLLAQKSFGLLSEPPFKLWSLWQCRLGSKRIIWWAVNCVYSRWIADFWSALIWKREVTWSDPQVMWSDPQITWSDPQVTWSDPRQLQTDHHDLPPASKQHSALGQISSPV